VTLRINQERWLYVFGSPVGPVGRYMGRVGARAESIGKVIATQEKLVRNGRYRASIAWRPGKDGRGIFVQVGAAVPYARYLEYGTPDHEILPRRPKYALWWTHGADRGWYVPEHPLPRVHHPGTRPYNVIHRAVLAAVRGGIR
jgi:hypothetical protein